MTHSAALTGPTLNGRDIGQAEHATRAVLDRLLARTGTQFHGWVIINLLAASGGALGEDELTAPLGGLDSPATRSLIDSLHTLLESTPPHLQTGADQ